MNLKISVKYQRKFKSTFRNWDLKKTFFRYAPNLKSDKSSRQWMKDSWSPAEEWSLFYFNCSRVLTLFQVRVGIVVYHKMMDFIKICRGSPYLRRPQILWTPSSDSTVVQNPECCLIVALWFKIQNLSWFITIYQVPELHVHLSLHCAKMKGNCVFWTTVASLARI